MQSEKNKGVFKYQDVSMPSANIYCNLNIIRGWCLNTEYRACPEHLREWLCGCFTSTVFFFVHLEKNIQTKKKKKSQRSPGKYGTWRVWHMRSSHTSVWPWNCCADVASRITDGRAFLSDHRVFDRYDRCARCLTFFFSRTTKNNGRRSVVFVGCLLKWKNYYFF